MSKTTTATLPFQVTSFCITIISITTSQNTSFAIVAIIITMPIITIINIITIITIPTITSSQGSFKADGIWSFACIFQKMGSSFKTLDILLPQTPDKYRDLKTEALKREGFY